MQLFYAPDIVPPYHILPEEESRHCVRVLRMQPGDELHLTDGRGSMYTCRVVEVDARRCSVEVVDCIREFEKMPYRLTMAVAPTKNIDRFEWFLEKATEVGVTEIYPLLCEHSERRTIKPEREQRVITSAVKQSLKAYHPVLHDMMPLRRLIASGFDGRRFIARASLSGRCGGKRRERTYFNRSRGRFFARRDYLCARKRIRADIIGASTPAHRDGRAGRHHDAVDAQLFAY